MKKRGEAAASPQRPKNAYAQKISLSANCNCREVVAVPKPAAYGPVTLLQGVTGRTGFLDEGVPEVQTHIEALSHGTPRPYPVADRREEYRQSRQRRANQVQKCLSHRECKDLSPNCPARNKKRNLRENLLTYFR